MDFQRHLYVANALACQSKHLRRVLGDGRSDPHQLLAPALCPRRRGLVRGRIRGRHRGGLSHRAHPLRCNNAARIRPVVPSTVIPSAVIPIASAVEQREIRRERGEAEVAVGLGASRGDHVISQPYSQRRRRIHRRKTTFTGEQPARSRASNESRCCSHCLVKAPMRCAQARSQRGTSRTSCKTFPSTSNTSLNNTISRRDHGTEISQSSTFYNLFRKSLSLFRPRSRVAP